MTAHRFRGWWHTARADTISHEMMRAEVWLQDTLNSSAGLEELAHRIGYSPSQIRRRFRDVFGISPGAYRDRLRMAKAARLLVQTPMSVRDVSRECSYGNHSAFTRAFQRHHGLTPRRYRRQRQIDLQLQLRQAQCHFVYQTDEVPASYALLTRLYNTPLALDEPNDWQQHLAIAPLELGGLEQHSRLAIVQDHQRIASPARLDLGIQTESAAAMDLALPPAFRLMSLPRQRIARLHLETVRQLGDAMCFMSCRSFSGEGEVLKGDPLQLVPHSQGLELRIPLRESA
ncbi:helix-turn-helix transcriptional regulator [Halomonas sabkhae]|uniref:helix-turn-helix transcriptional regulator n=1 Tax=Halomonas sabkhae TaxID=626223 RepID=UPI0025B40E40|nr:helix-turn-helix transcriptional regulator [Halomonas sabkhae]MDN3526355.1 helix-turn-helix transcriptional regulator [Halomonas sabkhae]